MSPKEKAMDLISEMLWQGENSEYHQFDEFAKQCARKAADLAIYNLEELKCELDDSATYAINQKIMFWEKVKNGISQL